MGFYIVFIISFLAISRSSYATSAVDELCDGNRKFTEKLFKELSTDQPNENFVFSPLAIQILLAAISSAGSNEKAELITEIRQVLSLPETNSRTQEAFKNISSKINKADDDFKIFEAIKFYFAPGYTVRQWYGTILREKFQTEVEENCDFKNSENSADKINSWVAKKTNNKIDKAVNVHEINSNTQCVLVNALYLSGKWDIPFNKDLNIEENFHGTKITRGVEMMRSNNSYEYAENDNAQYLKMELFREGGGAYVIFILPRKNKNFAEIENNAAELFTMPSFESAQVAVVLPKFNISSSIKMKPILQHLGINKAFQWDTTLDGVNYEGHPYMVINAINQKAVIEVTEWGITAASVINVQIIVDSTQNQERKTFVANHPFLFAVIVDEVIAYAGHVVNL